MGSTDSMCLGKLAVGGTSGVQVVGEQYITSGTKVVGDAVTLPLAPRASGSANRNGARVYFADSCEEGKYDPAMYSSWSLWNKTISFTVDLSGVSCGCNFAFYLTSLRYSSNAGRGGQGSWYCDAQPTAGSVCPEMDLMGAHRAPHSNLGGLRLPRDACRPSHSAHHATFPHPARRRGEQARLAHDGP